MNSNIVIAFAVIAAFGLVAATLVLPTAPQALAQVGTGPGQTSCSKNPGYILGQEPLHTYPAP